MKSSGSFPQPWWDPRAPVPSQCGSALGCDFSYQTPHSAFCHEYDFQLNVSSEPVWLGISLELGGWAVSSSKSLG